MLGLPVYAIEYFGTHFSCITFYCELFREGAYYLNFGPGNGTIWLDDVSCQGMETDLYQCNHSPWGQHDCGHSEDIGVACPGSFHWDLHLFVMFLEMSWTWLHFEQVHKYVFLCASRTHPAYLWSLCLFVCLFVCQCLCFQSIISLWIYNGLMWSNKHTYTYNGSFETLSTIVGLTDNQNFLINSSITVIDNLISHLQGGSQLPFEK